ILLLLICVFLMDSLRMLYGADEQQPFGIDRRIPWTTSHVIGSPDPPLPYTVEKVFTNLTWKNLMLVIPEPGSKRLMVVLGGGEKDDPSKILSVMDDPNTDKVDTFLVVSNWLVYSFAFHPGYRTNGYIYVFNTGAGPERGTNQFDCISRYTA